MISRRFQCFSAFRMPPGAKLAILVGNSSVFCVRCPTGARPRTHKHDFGREFKCFSLGACLQWPACAFYSRFAAFFWRCRKNSKFAFLVERCHKKWQIEGRPERNAYFFDASRPAWERDFHNVRHLSSENAIFFTFAACPQREARKS